MAIGATGVLVAALVAREAARSPSVRAAYRAFRNPALLDPPPPAPAPASVSCDRLATTGEDKPVDFDVSHAFDRPLPNDLDDPDGATLKSLVLPDVHVPITRRTMRFVRFLTRTNAGRAAFVQRYRRAALYRESITFALREAGLPEDLVWLAAVESGFDPHAVSPAGAAGLWQFMPDTAQLYGLDASPWVDERRSIARSTRAAVTHLRDLYERFGRWDLAIAAYNAGYDRVAAAMEKVARARGPMRLDDKPVEFADLAAARALPEETINYVPQIMAFALCAENRSRFGLDAPDLGAPLEMGEIAVPEGTRLRTIARAAGVSLSVLRDYNPQLLRDRVPPVGGDYLVSLPESRVQRALAAFPSYSDQEVLAQNDGDDDEHAHALGTIMDPDPLEVERRREADSDDPLPRRPVALGRNRLPEVAMPGVDRVLVTAAGLGVGMLEAKLPRSLAIPDIGYKRVFQDDPLGLLAASKRGGGALPARGREAAIDAQLGFLDAAPSVDALRAFALPNGITVRVRHDRGAPTTSITVRVATVDDCRSGGLASEPSTSGGLAGQPWTSVLPRGPEASETLHTITVDRADADAGIELAAARLRLSLGDTRAAELAEIRFRAGNARRRVLQSTPYGPAVLALGEALFPPEHPLAGTVLGAGEDGTALLDMSVAEALEREHARARGSITIVGDVDEQRARKIAEAFLMPVATPAAEPPILPHPREDRLTVEDDVPAPRVLVGWIGPGEGEPGDASLRVAIELLSNPRVRAFDKSHRYDGGRPPCPPAPPPRTRTNARPSRSGPAPAWPRSRPTPRPAATRPRPCARSTRSWSGSRARARAPARWGRRSSTSTRGWRRSAPRPPRRQGTTGWSTPPASPRSATPSSPARSTGWRRRSTR